MSVGPSINRFGILSGAILLLVGAVIWSVKGLCRKESLGPYLNILPSVLFLIVAIHDALGLGVAEYKVPLLFAGIFMSVGSEFFFLGWLLLGTQSLRQ
jgi:hypothetical protein